MTNEEKLQQLADKRGIDAQILIEESLNETLVPGICVNEGCDYTIDVEMDQDGATCIDCNTPTVKSCLVLAGEL